VNTTNFNQLKDHVCAGVNVVFGIFIPFVITNDFIFDEVKGSGVQVNNGSDIIILGVGIIYHGIFTNIQL